MSVPNWSAELPKRFYSNRHTDRLIDRVSEIGLKTEARECIKELKIQCFVSLYIFVVVIASIRWMQASSVLMLSKGVMDHHWS